MNMRNTLCTAFGTNAPYMAVYSTVPAGSAGTEPTGGSPAYARKPVTWGSASGGSISATQVVFDIPSGFTVAGGGFHSAVTAGNYMTGFSLTSQTFNSQGTYAVTPTVTIT